MARVGFDIDGVLYPFEVEFHRYAFGFAECGDCLPVSTWNFYEEWGYDKDWFVRTCNEGVNAGELFWHGIPYEEVIEQVERILNAGHDLVFITSRDYGAAGMSETATRSWLLEEFDLRSGDYELHLTQDKSTVQVDYHIDDNVNHYESMVKAGAHTFLMDRPWNRDFSAGARVHSLREFVDIVEEVERAQVAADELAQLSEEMGLYNEVRVTSETGGQKGQKMARVGSLDPEALLKVAEVAGFGERKYSRLNYMKGYDWSLSYDAGMRHRMAFWAGEDYDPESGLPHLAHAAWHDLAQLAFFLKGIGTDDRYKPESEEPI